MFKDLPIEEQEAILIEVKDIVIKEEFSKLADEKASIIESYKSQVSKLIKDIESKKLELNNINNLFNEEYSFRINEFEKIKNIVLDKENTIEKLRKEIEHNNALLKIKIEEYSDKLKEVESLKNKLLQESYVKEEALIEKERNLKFISSSLELREEIITNKEKELIVFDNKLLADNARLDAKEKELNSLSINLNAFENRLNDFNNDLNNKLNILNTNQESINQQLSDIIIKNNKLFERESLVTNKEIEVNLLLEKNNKELITISEQIAKNNAIIVALKVKEIDLNKKDQLLKERENNIKALESSLIK